MTPTHPITEDDIANFLIHTPAFFERHAELLTAVQLTSPHGNRAVSLQERQAEMLREKIKGLERRIMDMIRHGNENMLIADKLQRWARSLLRARAPAELPQRIVAEVQAEFGVPQAALKVWHVAGEYAGHGFAQGVSEDAKSFASSLTAPFCGVNPGLEAVQWLPAPAEAMSVALMPLRTGGPGGAEPAFGMLVLASPDPARFESGMGTDFLERIAELAGAALSRLQ
ncbi:DUF484 family protein [Pseudorhodoferax sp.]|uniref:DUF484 family protein n=1 Tax=Pseudorhodoferax sp. TaxID=1993553 RepID=UPI0039E36D7F